MCKKISIRYRKACAIDGVGAAMGKTKFKFIKTTDPEYSAERMLRWEVLRKPMGLPPGSEFSPEDPESLHLVALENKSLIGCILFHPESKHQGRVFQLALAEDYRGRGFGRKLIHALEEFLVKNGYLSIYCFVQEEIAGFYERMGFNSESETVSLNGIPHLKMKKNLFSTSVV